VDADGFVGEGFDAAVSAANVAAHPRPRAVVAALARVVRPGGAIAFAARPGSRWARYETAYRHFHAYDDFDVLERDGFAIVFARRP
jgi:hypothetical protein